MQIPGSPGPEPLRSPALPRQSPTPAAAGPVDSFVAGQEVAPPAYSEPPEPVRKLELPAEPAPRLDRPVLLVHGYMGHTWDFSAFRDWLTREGTNRWGGILEGANPGSVDPQANLFTLRFTTPYQGMETNAQEIKKAVEAICQATGASQVDVVAHSKGGLDTRKYLMDPDEKVNHVVQVASPNRGAMAINAEKWAREHGHPIKPSFTNPELEATLGELVADRLDRHGRPENPALHELNQNWEVQQDRAEFLSISAAGFPTLTDWRGLTLLGDDSVTRSSAAIPNAPARHVWGRHHQNVMRSPVTMREAAAFLTDAPLDPEVELFESAEDRARAQEQGLLDLPQQDLGLLADRPGGEVSGPRHGAL